MWGKYQERNKDKFIIDFFYLLWIHNINFKIYMSNFDCFLKSFLTLIEHKTFNRLLFHRFVYLKLLLMYIKAIKWRYYLYSLCLWCIIYSLSYLFFFIYLIVHIHIFFIRFRLRRFSLNIWYSRFYIIWRVYWFNMIILTKSIIINYLWLINLDFGHLIMMILILFDKTFLRLKNWFIIRF